MRNQWAEGALQLAAGAATLTEGWSFTQTSAGAYAEPASLAAAGPRWRDAVVPGTVAEAMRATGEWDIDATTDFDDFDWWYRVRLPRAGGAGERAVLQFDGLATIAEVWLDGERLLESSNMFVSHRIDVSRRIGDASELLICFRSLNAALAARRPRPRWKTKLVRQQQLRWFRTTLLGRIPGWTPPAAPVGPWRAITLDRGETSLHDIRVRTYVEHGDGVVEFSARLDGLDRVNSASQMPIVHLRVGAIEAPIGVSRDDDGWFAHGTLRLTSPDLWSPHTHGSPSLYPCSARITIENETRELPLPAVGFRTIDVDEGDGRFILSVNGERVFCRGVCWMPSDVVSLATNAADTRRALERLRDAGANMVRVGGTTIYESDAFYAACDELGILVWQDFMFANMEYPAADEAFVGSVRREAEQQTARLARHPSVAIYCGNSEVEQQAAMLGMPRDLWRNELFADVLPELCRTHHPGTHYVLSTPSGGALPFHTSEGLTHYYGVGAYLRGIEDVRRSAVRFTPECLGFSNVPEQRVVNQVFGGESPSTTDPRWKRRVPRDSGAGWDFEDVRDHYVRALYAVDPAALRYADTARYLALGRTATGEMMSRTFAEWRRAGSECGGALVWFARDLWAGAGWGILDHEGNPKAAYHYLRRAWQPVTVMLTDEGLNGIHAHVVNETAAAFHGVLVVTLLREGRVATAPARAPVTLGPRETKCCPLEELLGGFHDTSYAYRFGPAGHDVVAVALTTGDDRPIAEAFHFPQANDPRPVNPATVSAEAERTDESTWTITLRTDRFLHAVHLDIENAELADDYFHLMPDRDRRVIVRAANAGSAIGGWVEALNLAEPVRIGVRA